MNISSHRGFVGSGALIFVLLMLLVAAGAYYYFETSEREELLMERPATTNGIMLRGMELFLKNNGTTSQR